MMSDYEVPDMPMPLVEENDEFRHRIAELEKQLAEVTRTLQSALKIIQMHTTDYHNERDRASELEKQLAEAEEAQRLLDWVDRNNPQIFKTNISNENLTWGYQIAWLANDGKNYDIRTLTLRESLRLAHKAVNDE